MLSDDLNRIVEKNANISRIHDIILGAVRYSFFVSLALSAYYDDNSYLVVYIILAPIVAITTFFFASRSYEKLNKDIHDLLKRVEEKRRMDFVTNGENFKGGQKKTYN